MREHTNLLKNIILLFSLCIAISTALGEEILTPSILNPDALWTGSDDNGFLVETNYAQMLDNDPVTGCEVGPYASMILSSPVPFIPTKVEVVISTSAPDRSAAYIEIMRVGTCDFLSAGVDISGSETAGATVVLNIPAENQVPVSAIRIRSKVFWFRLNELKIHGSLIAPIDQTKDLTQSGILKAYKSGTTSVDGSALTNGVFENGTGGYHYGGSPHNIIVDFGSTPVKATSAYVAVNPNGYWKYPWAAVGTESTYSSPNDLLLMSAYTPTPTNTPASGGDDGAGHSWIVLPVTNKTLYAFGVRIDNYWGDLSEFKVTEITSSTTGTVLLIQ